MGEERIAPLMAYISVIRDTRVERNKLYPQDEVIIITIPAVIALAQGWEDIERYAKAKKDWLGRFLKLEHGIPPHDVYPPSRKRVLGDVPDKAGGSGTMLHGMGAGDTAEL